VHVQTLADISTITKLDSIFSLKTFIRKQYTTHNNALMIDKDVMDEFQLEEAARSTERFSERSSENDAI